MSVTFKYYAFISYNQQDVRWGKRLEQKLGGYKMPTTLCNERGWKRKPINPIFFAPYDIQPGDLNEEIKSRLRVSRNLIVICSPHSAKSEWVGKEIAYFHQLGRTKQIHFFIVDGLPHSGNPDTECFNPIVNTLGLPEILGANIHEQVSHFPWINRERAYVQLVSKLLDVEFDSIWKRHKRQLIQKVITWFVGCIIVLSSLIGIWIVNQPVNVQFQLREVSPYNPNIPPLKDAVVSIMMENETKSDTIPSINAKVIFPNIPHHYIGQNVRINVCCEDFMSIDTILSLTKNQTIHIRRNPNVYGDIRFIVWSVTKERGIAGVKLQIAGRNVISDKNGQVHISIPIEEQLSAYPIQCKLPLERSTIYPPCGSDDVLILKE